MNLEILAQLETHRREADVRHHLDERSLERAANRRRQRTATPDVEGQGLLSRFFGWLAPKRIATASGETIQSAPQAQGVAAEAGDDRACGMDCTAEQAA